MNILPYFATFLAGLFVGYLFALFEAWVDKKDGEG